ncbi:hypothetical protein D5396_17200, partial [Rahnella inusitata]
PKPQTPKLSDAFKIPPRRDKKILLRECFETYGSKTERRDRGAARFCASTEVTEHVHRSGDSACLKKRGEI